MIAAWLDKSDLTQHRSDHHAPLHARPERANRK